MSRFPKFGFAVAVALASASAFAASPPLPAFTAHYRLLRNGSPIGQATLSLTRGDGGAWTFVTDSRGTSGLASLLGASTDERSTFRWVGALPQGISYDYKMTTALKDQQRHVRFDWSSHVIEVDDHGVHRFPTQPGAIERHTVPLALAAALAAGAQQIDLPVAVRDRIEIQHYATRGTQPVTVPAGTFDAVQVSRNGGGDAFEAWFAPGKLPVPVKIDQRGKNDYALELEDWSPQG